MINVLGVFPMLRVHIVCHKVHMEKTYCFLLLKHYLVKFYTQSTLKEATKKAPYMYVCT